MKKSPLKGLIIRTAVVYRRNYGFIYACDPKKEKRGVPHVITFAWTEEGFERGDANYDAHSACLITDPDRGIVDVSEAGYYTVNAKSDLATGDIFENSHPTPPTSRARGIRSVSAIAGKAYAVGIRGMVYRLDALANWTRIDDGLPESFDVQAIDGFSGTDLYAVGFGGQLWRYTRQRWKREDLPTNTNLTSVKCGGDRNVYVGGHGGVLIRGKEGRWEVIQHASTTDDIWDLEWFADRLYISTLDGLFALDKRKLAPVAFGKDAPKSFYQLSSADGEMWSNGEHDVMSFDGKSWTRIV